MMMMVAPTIVVVMMMMVHRHPVGANGHIGEFDLFGPRLLLERA